MAYTLRRPGGGAGTARAPRGMVHCTTVVILLDVSALPPGGHRVVGVSGLVHALPACIRGRQGVSMRKAWTEAPDRTSDERGRRSQPGWGGLRSVDRVASDRATVLWLPNSRREHSSRPTVDWLCQVVPRACGAAAVVIVAATFWLQNPQAVTVRLLDWRIEGVPLAAAMLLCGALGAAVATVLWLAARRELIVRAPRLEARFRSDESGRRHRSDKPTTRLSSGSTQDGPRLLPRPASGGPGPPPA
jgi:uncharacterized integral membrane protein